MKEKLWKAAAEVGLSIREVAVKAPFCIAPQVFVISVEGSTIAFGQCTSQEDRWHAFIETRFPGPVVSIVSAIQPARCEIIAGRTVVTFNPLDVSDDTLTEVIFNFKQFSLLAAGAAIFL